MITKISLVLLVSFFIASCGNDKNANSVNGSSNRLTFSVDWDIGDCQDADLNDKNYIFAVSEKENCNDLMTGNELNYTNILYISKSSLTGEKTICTSAGCKFSTDRFFIKSGAEQIEFPKDKMLIGKGYLTCFIRSIVTKRETICIIVLTQKNQRYKLIGIGFLKYQVREEIHDEILTRSRTNVYSC